MVKINPEKIPVRIIQATDNHGNKEIGVTLDISYYVDTGGDPSGQVEKFRKLYFTTLKKAEKLFKSKNKKRRTSNEFWQLSKILQEFNKKTENEFEITNYPTALERDFKLTDSYVRIIFDFGNFFKESEVLDIIPFSTYFELALKKRQLEKLGLFEKEKGRLLRIAKQGNTPKHKEYREELKKLIHSK